MVAPAAETIDLEAIASAPEVPISVKPFGVDFVLSKASQITPPDHTTGFYPDTTSLPRSERHLGELPETGRRQVLAR